MKLGTAIAAKIAMIAIATINSTNVNPFLFIECIVFAVMFINLTIVYMVKMSIDETLIKKVKSDSKDRK